MADNQRARFVQQYGPVADRVAAQTGISRDVLLSQWGLETGWGKSVIPGTNNLGNIKDFSGRGVRARDNMTDSRDAYRAYATPEAFGDDYASLLARRYPGALGAGDDVMRFSSALKAGGYAEDPRYVDKMASIYGGLTGAPTAGPGANAPTDSPIDADALYGIAPAAGPASGPKIAKITTAPGAISKGMASQQTQRQDAAPTPAAQTPDYSAWIDNYIRSIVNNA
ncbi:hypothetical protein OKW38_002217 [Paraburkholderia sp. MM5496-R1]|uniref:glucosaminidase domain-containing protein n=1 Tax=Paraburkholderia sp. MM5496-R1 TaxID=2991065 RepID=UPI003D252714